MWQSLSRCGLKRCTTSLKVQALGLQEQYKAEDEILKSFVQKTAAICFIPPTFVHVAWQGLATWDSWYWHRIDYFVEYFGRTWINGQYRISQWNYYDCHGPRTNNHVEGWHSWLKKIVRESHPNIFEIINVMCKEQATTEMKLNQFEAGDMQPSWKRRCVQRDARLTTLFERFQNGECNLTDRVFSCCSTSKLTLETIISYWWNCVCILTY